MNKEQAQIYINNVGQSYKHYTRAAYLVYLVMALGFLGAAVGFCHELPMVIIVCALSAFTIVFTFVVVKKYMSVLRISVVNAVYLALWAVAMNCIAYSIQFYDGSFVTWEYCLCISIQIVVFAVSAIVSFVVAQKAKPKKVMIACVTTAAAGGTAGIALSRFITNTLHPDSDTTLLIMTVLLNILVCILVVCVAILFVRIVIMRRYGVEYQPEYLVICNVCKTIQAQKNEMFTTVHGFVFDDYTFYIYAKRDCFRFDLYDGNIRISHNKYETLDSLYDSEKINGKKLTKIWNDVKPL